MRERMIPSRSVVPTQRGMARCSVVVANAGSLIVIGRTAVKRVVASSGPFAGLDRVFCPASKGGGGDD